MLPANIILLKAIVFTDTAVVKAIPSLPHTNGDTFQGKLVL